MTNRLNARPRAIITTVDDPDFDAKIPSAISRQIQAAADNGEAAV